jgi:hypothetical protein
VVGDVDFVTLGAGVAAAADGVALALGVAVAVGEGLPCESETFVATTPPMMPMMPMMPMARFSTAQSVLPFCCHSRRRPSPSDLGKGPLTCGFAL